MARRSKNRSNRGSNSIKRNPSSNGGPPDPPLQELLQQVRESLRNETVPVEGATSTLSKEERTEFKVGAARTRGYVVTIIALSCAVVFLALNLPGTQKLVRNTPWKWTPLAVVMIANLALLYGIRTMVWVKRLRWALASQAVLFAIVIFGYGAYFYFTPLCLEDTVISKVLEGPPAPTTFEGCLYFSVVTATSLGYGDVHPSVPNRLYAASEAFVGYLHLGMMIWMLTARPKWVPEK